VIAVDTNVLVYAHRRESRFHDAAFELMQSLTEGAQIWAIPWPCIYEFFSVATNPRIWTLLPSTPDQATDQLLAWLQSPSVRLLTETDDFFDVLRPLLRQPRVRGPVAHDARVAALCVAHGASELLTKDRDFQLFPQLTTRDPFA
jgi:toxin-antitoxin system PIN domain toxin